MIASIQHTPMFREAVENEVRLRTRALTAALSAARAYVADHLHGTLECVCVLDRETLEPIRETIDPEERKHVEEIERHLAMIDAALANVGSRP